MHVISDLPTDSQPTLEGDVVIDKQITFTCVVGDTGNPPAHAYVWQSSDDSWSCSENGNAYMCTVANDCNVTVGCAAENEAGPGVMGYFNTGMGKGIT